MGGDEDREGKFHPPNMLALKAKGTQQVPDVALGEPEEGMSFIPPNNMLNWKGSPAEGDDEWDDISCKPVIPLSAYPSTLN